LFKQLITSFFIMSLRSRRSRRFYSRSLKLVNWNNQTVHVFSAVNFPGGQTVCGYCVLIKNQSVGDMKVKNFTLKIALGICPVPLCYALVYVPYTVHPETCDILVGTPIQPVQSYDPPQNGIMSGTRPTTSGVPVTFHSRRARNLEPTDAIVLLIKLIYPNDTQGSWEIPMDAILNYVNTCN
jgi:hypothetical protein